MCLIIFPTLWSFRMSQTELLMRPQNVTAFLSNPVPVSFRWWQIPFLLQICAPFSLHCTRYISLVFCLIECKCGLPWSSSHAVKFSVIFSLCLCKSALRLQFQGRIEIRCCESKERIYNQQLLLGCGWSHLLMLNWLFGVTHCVSSEAYINVAMCPTWHIFW